MELMNEYVKEYKKQLEKGFIQKAYRGLMEYLMEVRIHFARKCPDLAPGNLYHGYMDMSYFPLFPESLKSRKLKIGIVLIHARVRFEAWLVGYNKQVQAEYWKLFKESNFNKYRIPATIKGADSIIECTLDNDPDFSDPDELTKKIEKGTLKFIKDIEEFLYKH